MNRFFNVIGKTYLRVAGWKTQGTPMPGDKCIFVAAFHTSNWDFVHGMAVRFTVPRPISWLGKHTLFLGPMGYLMRALGGVPVFRHLRQNVVDQVVAMFRAKPVFAICVTPEATRKKVTKWKSGFYHIALKAGVPLQGMAFDYPSKTIIFDELFYPSGDLNRDLDYLKNFFSRYKPKYPEKAELNFEIDPPPPENGTQPTG